jgi:hypothetical protein
MVVLGKKGFEGFGNHDIVSLLLHRKLMLKIQDRIPSTDPQDSPSFAASACCFIPHSQIVLSMD